jgi:hypothetical protein
MMMMACGTRLVGRGIIEAERAPIWREPQIACPNPLARESRTRKIINCDGEAAGCPQLGRPATIAASDTGAWAKQQFWRA